MFAIYGTITGMKHLGRELSDHDWSLVCCGLMPLRPMTPEEKAYEDERQKHEAEWINRHPYLFLLKFTLALSFLIFSIFLVHRTWIKAVGSPLAWRVP